MVLKIVRAACQNKSGLRGKNAEFFWKKTGFGTKKRKFQVLFSGTALTPSLMISHTLSQGASLIKTRTGIPLLAMAFKAGLTCFSGGAMAGQAKETGKQATQGAARQAGAGSGTVTGDCRFESAIVGDQHCCVSKHAPKLTLTMLSH